MLAERENLALTFSNRVDELEKAMLKLPQVSCPVIHRFGPGIYIREVSIPGNTFAVGHHQNFEHLNVMLKGRVTVLNEDGSTSELCAPLIFVGKPGRKIGYIHEDMVWLNIYQTDETDVEKLEAALITKSDGWLEDAKQKKLLQDFKGEIHKQDYLQLLSEFGVSEEQAKEQAKNEGDFIELPYGGFKIKIADSNIEGRGLFATADIAEGEIIAPARINGFRTIAGRFTNHSVNHNAKMVRMNEGDIALVATRNIQGCKGGEDGEEITISYREALQLTLQIGKE